MKYIVIFPNEKQLEIIEGYDENIKKEILVVPNKCVPKDEKMILKSLKLNEEKAEILCCHEEGIYWLKNNIKHGMELMFHEECLKMLTKWDEYEKFIENSIPCVSKVKDVDKIKKFPIVAKPNIGFGSVGVKKLNNYDELYEYIENFDKMMQNSIVHKDKKIFFKEEKNFPIYEECIDNGQFFSIPFIVNDKHEVFIFPVIGIRKDNTKTSNYKWSTFMYGKNVVNDQIKQDIKKIVKSISDKWVKKPSVNMVEMIYDNERKKLNVLEFSPRIVGGRIAKMIKYASGIDLDRISIENFLKINKIKVEGKNNQTTIVDICNIDSDGKEENSYDSEILLDYKLLEEEIIKSPIGDNKIIYKIYGKLYK